MNDKIIHVGATILAFLIVFACFSAGYQLRIESVSTEDIKEASGAHDIERRVLELETRVAELERMARK